MRELAQMPKPALLASLRQLALAYGRWIEREAAKIGDSAERLAAHATAAQRALDRCARARDRIQEGIELIGNDTVAEEAFRFANHSMWLQRVHSTYARQIRKQELAAGAPGKGVHPSYGSLWLTTWVWVVSVSAMPRKLRVHYPGAICTGG